MKKVFILIMSVLLFADINAQSLKNGSVNTQDYPTISFIWNEYNPNVKDKAQFILTEDGKKIPFTLDVKRVNPTKKEKRVLFLWEDTDDINLFDFSRQFLFYFLQNGVNQNFFGKGDKFNIATYNINQAGNRCIQPLSSDFTDNIDYLLTEINNKSFNPYESKADIYRAIDEGIDLLDKESSECIRMLVVVSNGISCSKSVSGKNDASDSKAEALKSKIPVSLIEYNGSYVSRFSEKIVDDTYGVHIMTTSYAQAQAELDSYYAEIAQRHCGQDYQITFNTSQKKDGKSHNVILTVGAIEQPIRFETPFSVLVWMENNLVITISVGLGILLIIVLVVVFIVNTRKKQQYAKEQIAQMEAQNIRNQEEAKRNQQEFLNYQRQQQEKAKAEEEARNRAKQQEQHEHLLGLMQTKNMFPRLQCVAGEQSFIYNVDKPITTIGRSSTNDVVFAVNTVSKKHAEIVFTGGGFEIHDLGSTNHVIVNGQFVETATLKNADIIGLGDALVTFYI